MHQSDAIRLGIVCKTDLSELGLALNRIEKDGNLHICILEIRL